MINQSYKLNFFTQKEQTLYKKKHSLPKVFSFTYKAHDGVKYAGWCRFDWQETLDVFREVMGDNPENVSAQLAIRVNYHNTLLTVRVIGSNGKEVFIEPKDMEIFKISDIRQKYVTPHE